jgi:hypothetical protein
MNRTELKALKQVIKYLWKDEKRNWEELDRPDNHIFETLIELNCYYQKINKRNKIIDTMNK